jgi:HK97 family phage prohead protease
MPYFITDKSSDCSGWATVKSDGTVIGCHTTKQDAIDQMVAVSIAEDIAPGGERILSGDPAVIVDIDDTLIHMGQPMQDVIDYVNGLEGSVFVVTARVVSRKDETAKQLDEIGLQYSRLFMKDTEGSASAYKKTVAEELLKTYNVYLAIDNDSANRAVFSELGIETKDPATISSDSNPSENQASRWSSVNILLMKEKEEKMKNKIERRIKNDVDFELRIQDGKSDGMRFTGYAAVFNSDSEPLPFTERILPGAFKRSLKSRNEIKLFMNHNMDKVLGSTRAKTLKLTEDSNGLLAEAILPDTTDGRDLSVLMQRGDVNSMSFGFSVPNGGDRWTNDGQTRELKEVRLHEVSIVTGFPAYEATSASVRSLDTLAQVLGMDADMLDFVIGKLEDGEPLSGDQADLIIEIVSKLREDAPMDMPTPDQMPTLDQIVIEELASLEIKRKHLDLLFKQTQ